MSQEESPHNSHMLFVGQQCHSPQCYMVDFLPLTCEHCKAAFCADHYRPVDHSCAKFDAAKHDRVAPQCPLCNKPVAIPLNEDPNLRMEQHIESECGRAARPGAMPLCARGRCGKRLFAPIKCNGCGEQFCAAHRFASAHECSGAGAVKAAAAAQGAGPSLASRTSAASAAAMAAIRRNAATISAPKSKPASTSSKSASTSSKPASTSSKPASTASKPASTSSGRASTSTSGGAAKAESSKHTNPFSKTDRRARAEQESRLKGLRERAKKGLLSEREQVLLAEAEAELSGKKDSECVVM